MEEKKEVLSKFISKKGKMVVLLDPPFGGRVEPLARTLQEIEKEYSTKTNRSE